MEYKTVGNLKIPQNLSPEKRAIVDEIARNYAAKNREIEADNLKNMGRIALGSLVSGASFHPILNIPYVGTGLGGAMYDAGQAIVEGDKLGDIAKRAGRGFAIGETVGAVPYVGKGVNKLSGGKIGNAVDAVAEKVAANPAVQKAYDALMTDVKAFNPNKQTAYHGSPYDFEKFSNEAIGTGEGAQAHGIGHYAALDKDVAEGYRKRLGASNTETDIEELKDLNKGFKYNLLARGKEDTLNKLNELIEANKNIPDKLQEFEKYKNIVENFNENNLLPSGQLYKLSVPKDDVMLREDLPFSEQPKAVQEALKKLAKDYKEIGYGDLLDSIGYDEKGESFYRLYNRLAGNGENAARELNDYGIKGISYNGGIDGEARVIFNPDDIDIVRKYYNQPTINDLLNKINAGSSSDSIYQYLNNPKANKNFEKELQSLINPPANVDENTIRALIGGISDDAYNLGLKNGYDLTNFNHILDKSAYNHFLKHYGNNEVADNLLPLTIDDLRDIPNIIYSPDSLEFIEGTKRKLPRIKYTRKTDNGNQTYFEQIQNKTKRLNTKTYWKEK